MTITLDFGWWMLPAAVFVIGVLWVCWPRPREWGCYGDYSWPSGMLTLPLRAAAALIAVLLAVIVWRW